MTRKHVRDVVAGEDLQMDLLCDIARGKPFVMVIAESISPDGEILQGRLKVGQVQSPEEIAILLEQALAGIKRDFPTNTFND